MTSALKKTHAAKEKSHNSMQDEPIAKSGRSYLRPKRNEDTSKLVKYIDDNIIGKGSSFVGPFGRRKVVYCDYNGSGRSLQFLEDYIIRDVLPSHAGTCTAMSSTSLQTSIFRREARVTALECVHGTAFRHGAALGASPLSVASALCGANAPPPVLFLGKDHTDRGAAPWTQLGAKIVLIPETKDGFIDLNFLEFKLREHTGCGRRLIGLFSAVSKVTGVLADDVATTLLLHQYGAWAFWDYTLAAPSVQMDMCPNVPGVDELAVEKDAIFFNCSKFVGGVQAPMVAVFRKDIFKENPLYAESSEELMDHIEECGAVEAVRAALVIHLRDAVGLQSIAHRQDKITRQVIAHIKNIPELILLGSDSPSARRLPIFSLLVKHPRGTFLHHNFICAILNDMFGIQARGGLSGSLNYGQTLLGIDDKLLQEYEKILNVELLKATNKTEKANESSKNLEQVDYHQEHMRPGFARISLPFFMSDAELAFILEALKMVATEGWKLLPQYVINPVTGQWKHHQNTVLRDRKSLNNIRFTDGKMTANERRISAGTGIFPQTYSECLQTARNIFNKSRKLAQRYPITEQEVTFNARTNYLRWFMLPKEAHDLLLGNSSNVKQIVPFDPSGYTGARKSLMGLNRNLSTCSPVLGASGRHYSLSALDDNQFTRFVKKQRSFSREPDLEEGRELIPEPIKTGTVKAPPVQFIVGDNMCSVNLGAHKSPLKIETNMSRTRCHSLGSDILTPPALSPQMRQNVGLVSDTKKMTMCNCGSQTDLQSLDDPMVSPQQSFSFVSGSNSDCSQVGRSSPTVSIASHNSDDLHAYVKEMTKEIAIELKSEIREVITQVEDRLDNTECVDLSNVNMNSNSSQFNDPNSISVSEVAHYIMGFSKEMASEVTSEIRHMVNKVDEMISPDVSGTNFYISSPNGSRKNSPPEIVTKKCRSSSDMILPLYQHYDSNILMKKSPTSPGSIARTEVGATIAADSQCASPQKYSRDVAQNEANSASNVSINSSETSSPDTIIQVLANPTVVTSIPKSLSSNKLSDDDTCCNELECRLLQCKNRNWRLNNSVSSQDSGINMSFPELDSCHELGKWRTSSDSSAYGRQRNRNNKLGCCTLRHEKNEVPDIIEGVPVCSSEYYKTHHQPEKTEDTSNKHRVEFTVDDIKSDSRKSSNRSNNSESNSKRTSRSSLASSGDHTDYSKTFSSGYDTLPSRNLSQTSDEFKSERQNSESSSEGTTDGGSFGDFLFDEEGKWYCPPKSIWKGTVEAIQEFGMIRHQDKILVCLSGGKNSLGLLHTLHQYQFYAKAKGIHFTIGAVTIHDSSSNIDPLHLMAYCRTLGVKYVYCDKNDVDSGSRSNSTSEKPRRNSNRPLEGCSFTNKTIRRRIYEAANEHRFNVIALGQNMDDVARSFMVSVFDNGSLKAMKAHYFIRDQSLRVIRPFIYVREKNVHQFTNGRLPDFAVTAFGPSEDFKYGNDDTSSGDSTPELRQSPEKYAENSLISNKLLMRDRLTSEPCRESAPLQVPQNQQAEKRRNRTQSAPCGVDLLTYHERSCPGLFNNLKSALHPLISARSIDLKDTKEHRHRKRSVIQMKNGTPVNISEEGTDEEPVP